MDKNDRVQIYGWITLMARVVIFLFWLLFAAFVLEFSIGVRISEIPGFSLKNIAIYGLIVALFIVNPSRNKPFIANNDVNLYIILFIIYCLLSLIATKMLNVVPGYSLVGELILFKSYMDPYVLFILTYSILHDVKSIQKLLALLIVLFIVFLAITGLSSFGLLNVSRVVVDEKWGRTRGAFAEANQFAAYLVAFMPLLAAFIFMSKNRLIKLFLICIMLVAFYILLLTGSRGGLVSLIVAIGMYYMFNSKQGFAKSLINLSVVYMLILFALTLVFFTLPETTADGLMLKISGDFTETNDTDYSSGRLDMWTHAFTYYLKTPIFGTGWNTFIPLFIGNSHSDYVLFLVTTGVVGLFLFISIFYRMFKSVLTLRKRDKKYAQFYNAYISSLSAFVTSMLFVNIYNPMYFMMLYSALVLKLGDVAISKKVIHKEDKDKDISSERVLLKSDSVRLR